MRELLNRMHEWMAAYMKSFYSDDAEVQQGILLKEKHTGYVTSNCVELAKFLKLSTHDTELAEIIGLFHDVGRFYQYKIYKTFNDADSEDHADLALKVIDKLEFFNELSAQDFDVVKFAIQNHNKKLIAPCDDERKIFFAKIIRDADKLDIYRVLEPFLAQSAADKMPNFIKATSRLKFIWGCTPTMPPVALIPIAVRISSTPLIAQSQSALTIASKLQRLSSKKIKPKSLKSGSRSTSLIA